MANSDEADSWDEASPQTQEELLTKQFYAWEKQGRGWTVWPYPVELEPPFQPFLGHYAASFPAIDDARKPTVLSSVVESVRNYFAPPVAEDEDIEDEPVIPFPDTSKEDLVELAVTLPSTHETRKEVAERFLLSLTQTAHPLSFEMVGLADSISLQLVCRETDRAQLYQQLHAYFPTSVISEKKAYLKKCWDKTKGKAAVIVEFGLSREFMLPLRVVKSFDVDPLIGVAAALEDLGEDELGLLQVLFQPVRHAWAESMMRSVTDGEGKSFFGDASEIVPLTSKKVSRPLLAAVIRIAAKTTASDRAWQIAKALGGALAQFSNPLSNEFIPLVNDDYPASDHEHDLLFRKTHRSGMILNCEELVSLVHLPSESVQSEKLKRERKRTKAAPPLAFGHSLALGENRHNGNTSLVTLGPDQRIRHTYVIGASGTGKSTLLLNMVIQDIEHGEGVGVLDPHGDLIDKILGAIPEKRQEDVILFDPQDSDYPIGFNILSAHSELEKELLASDLVGVFKRFSLGWGDQIHSVLANAILAFLENPRGGTLKDLRRFLIDPSFRLDYLKEVQDDAVVFYWQREFPLLIGRPQVPILTRLDTFLRPRVIRHIVSQKDNRLNFREILDTGKIFLCKLTHGGIGEENAHILGSLIVTKLQQAVMSRQEVEERQRQNFYLYIDEFQNFITPSMEAILSGARKYHLGLILAHQDLRQVWGKDQDLAHSVISNPYTRICFRLGDFDAQKLKQGFSFFDAKDLQNLGTGEAICRLEQAEYDFNLTTPKPSEIPGELAKKRSAAIVALSRTKYARKREEVEKEVDLGRVSSPLEEVAAFPTKQQVRDKKTHGAVEREELTIDERKFLEFSSEHPDLFVTQIYEALGLSGYKGDKLKEGLIEKDYLSQEETRQGGGGRLAKLIRLTEKGARAIKGYASAGNGKGGDLHQEIQVMLKEQAELYGWKAKIEEKIPGTLESVDVGLTKDDLRVAIEISVTTRAEQEIPNIRKCLEAGYDYVISACAEEGSLAALKKLARKSFTAGERERIRLCLTTRLKGLLHDLAPPGIVSETGVVSGRIPFQKQLLSIKEASQSLGISSHTLYGWVTQRKIPFTKVGHLTKFRREELEGWLKRRSTKEERRDFL